VTQYTCTVGKKNSAAKYFVDSPDDVMDLLRALSGVARSSKRTRSVGDLRKMVAVRGAAGVPHAAAVPGTVSPAYVVWVCLSVSEWRVTSCADAELPRVHRPPHLTHAYRIPSFHLKRCLWKEPALAAPLTGEREGCGWTRD
jgi:hypothetical protein